jgi:antitoxin component of MazEF toxin-antitoxin module
MKTQIMRIGNNLFIKIPKSIEKLYELKPRQDLHIYTVEKNNTVILNCTVLNSNNDFKDSK